MNTAEKKIDELPDCAVLTKKQVTALTGLSRFTFDHLTPAFRAAASATERRLIGFPKGKLLAWLERRTDDATDAA